MMPGPAALAVQTGAALVPAILWYTDDGWGVHLHPEIAVPADGDRKQKAAAMTQQLADVFAEGIRKHPADWHMLQPVFTADLDQERLAAAIARAAGAARGPGGRARGAGGGVRVGLVCPYTGRCPVASRSTSGTSPRP